jgi:hypothetical protein
LQSNSIPTWPTKRQAETPITPYDEQHYVTYLRLLDASRDGADWQEVARIVLHRDPIAEEARSRRCWESHLARAQWLSGSGYRRISGTGGRDGCARQEVGVGLSA